MGDPGPTGRRGPRAHRQEGTQGPQRGEVDPGPTDRRGPRAHREERLTQGPQRGGDPEPTERREPGPTERLTQGLHPLDPLKAFNLGEL